MIGRDETGEGDRTDGARSRRVAPVRPIAAASQRAVPDLLPTLLACVAALGGCGGDTGTRHATDAGAAPGEPSATIAGDADGTGLGASDRGETEDVTTPIARAPIRPATPGVPTRPARPADPVATSAAAPVSSAVPPARLQQFEDDPSRLEPIPDVAHVEVLASSGLQVVYTTEAQRTVVDPGYVDAQWQHMQRCTGVVAPAPLVLLVEDEARPLTPEDDVVLDIDGLALASASTDAAGTTLQVLDAELAPGAPDRGFALRAITGRWLWQGASLPERDYPFACANEEPAADD